MPRESQVPLCRECEWELVRIGTKFFCQRTTCSRFALATNDSGDTPDEHEQRGEDEGVERERRQAS